jgi:superfamily II DNA/RNA helicase
MQRQAWAIPLKRLPLVGVSPTGSGKTLAHAIPTLVSGATTTTSILILAPTRELVHQVSKVCSKISNGLRKTCSDLAATRVIIIHGGEEKGSDSFARIPSHLTQFLHVCAEHKKARKLVNTLQTTRKEEQGRNHLLGIVFFGRIEKLKYVSKLLCSRKVSSVSRCTANCPTMCEKITCTCSRREKHL